MSSPIRQAEFVIDESQQRSTTFKVVVPSVGVDVGKSYVRVATAVKQDGKVHVKLATFAIDALQGALSYAKTSVADADSPHVFHTGHVTSEIERQIATTFDKAKEIKRQEKLTSHCNGAHFLVGSGLPDEQLFHDTTALEAMTTGQSFDFANMKAFMPAKSCEAIETLLKNVEAMRNEQFPCTVSVVGSNNVICKVYGDGTYQVADVRCCGGYAMTALWKAVKPPTCPVEDFNGLMRLARSGNRRNIDNITSEVLESVGFYSMMPKDFPIFAFGKMERLSRDQVAVEDLARAIVALNTDMVFNKAMDLSMMMKAYQVYYTGSLVQESFIREDIVARTTAWKFPGMRGVKFFKTDATAALGACLLQSN